MEIKRLTRVKIVVDTDDGDAHEFFVRLGEGNYGKATFETPIGRYQVDLDQGLLLKVDA